jgi:hypothetical protein
MNETIDVSTSKRTPAPEMHKNDNSINKLITTNTAATTTTTTTTTIDDDDDYDDDDGGGDDECIKFG